ncbi:MAG: adenosylmethionine decarboxylase [Dehalococcoidia bacterium]|nr:adenosylmethionine decarboxylase [Dehalococcoidia bacterium]
MNALGQHIILELKECNPKLLNDLPFLQAALLEAAECTGATIIGKTFHQFSPHGVTGVIAIAESHLCIHTWPEYEYAAVDIFTCGENFNAHKAATLIINRLESRNHSLMVVERGVLGERVAGQVS